MWSNANESGTVQVIVQPFPDPSGGKWQVSGKGGTFAKWRRDGRELYYLDPEGQIIAVPVETEHNFEFGRPTPLFKTPGPNTPYEITPDGQRFLVLADAAAVNTAPPPDHRGAQLVLNPQTLGPHRINTPLPSAE